MSFQPVDFDLSGSLELARKLWALGQTVGVLSARRDRHIETASKGWVGPHGDTFRLEAGNEQDDFTSTKTALQDAAESWAEAWAQAKDENNRREHAAKVEQERASRSMGERFFDNFLGDDSVVEAGPAPGPVPVPASPRFSPTD